MTGRSHPKGRPQKVKLFPSLHLEYRRELHRIEADVLFVPKPIKSARMVHADDGVDFFRG